MAKKKYYVVRKGKTPGIYESWDECKNQVDGVSGAEYKSFSTLLEAKQYFGGEEKKQESISEQISIIDNDTLVAYVDGSYNVETAEFSYGMVIIHNGKEEYFSQKVTNAGVAEMRNVAGEIKGAEAAMSYAADKGFKKLLIYHDYEGIAKWCTGEWKAKKDGTKAYVNYFNSIKDKVEINFVKVLGHSNDKYNDMADALAKQAIFGTNTETENENSETKEMKENVYICRELEELKEMLVNEGNNIWEDFCCSDMSEVGHQIRFTFSVGGKTAKLDIYQRMDGSTTFYPIGSNTELSILLKQSIEKQGLRNTAENKNYTIFLGKDWFEKTIDFLRQLPGVETSENNTGDKLFYQFTSKIGDKLTLNIYKDYKVGVQGKPLYLYNEFLSFVSSAPQITVNDVVDMTNTFIETNINVNDSKAKMSELLPNAYNSGKIEETIWKLFSPSMALIEDERQLDDYTCCVFPALRALEGYLKMLLFNKGIIVDDKYNFGSVFKPEVEGDKNSKFILHSNQRSKINDNKYENSLEEIYNYFKRSRHVLFHVDHILCNTRMIEDKQEARDIFYKVVELLEGTFVAIYV